jgi:hypothetical protein
MSCKPGTTNNYPETYSVEIENPLAESRKDVSVFIRITQLHDNASFIVRSNEMQLASEHHNGGVLVYLDSMKANEKRTLTIYFNNGSSLTESYPRKRTQAELSHRAGGEWKDEKYVGGTFTNTHELKVPKQHKNHDDFIRYEGPGWESDKVAYRLYLDQRNAIDVFGKKTNDMVLMGVGHDGEVSYHEMQSWGMDIMKVGESLGLGSIGIWNDSVALRIENTDGVICKVQDGNLTSSIALSYVGWKTPKDTVNISSTLIINGGSRLTNYLVNVKDNILCTGIIKDKTAKDFKSKGTNASWGYIATYGKQSLNKDNLGLVVLFPDNSFVAFHEDRFNHVVELRPDTFGVNYSFAAAWELEPNGLTNEKDFIKWVEKSARELANPVIIHAK